MASVYGELIADIERQKFWLEERFEPNIFKPKMIRKFWQIGQIRASR